MMYNQQKGNVEILENYYLYLNIYSASSFEAV